MDGECAFCGRADAATDELFCQDCQADHGVCQACAEDATREAAQLGLARASQAA